MSTVAEEIQRIKQAKSDIKTSIINKGVAVDDTATLDAYPGLIDGIQIGGSQAKIKVGENKIKLAFSTFTEVPDVFDFSDVTDMWSMFRDCTSLTTIPQMDTSNVTTMWYMLSQCDSLTTIPEMDTSKVTQMSSMFWYCTSLTTIPQMDTSKVTQMSQMFEGCSLLTTVPEMDTSKVSDMWGMFWDCPSLTDLGGFIGLKCDLDLSPCTALTHDSLMNVINKASDVTEAPATLTLGVDNLAKLSDAEKAVATAKGWTLA